MLTISVCYIVKNEADNLLRSLASARELADEIIVVDTGSTDSTVKLATAAGAKVAHFPWADDFSAPRNHAIQQAAGDWIIFLDADEAFEMPPTKCEMTRYLQDLAVTDAVLLCRHNIESHAKRDEFHVDWAPRIFRNAPELRYRGCIHEHIDRKGGPLRVDYAPESWYLLHTGYAASISADKCRRNLAILQKVIANGDWEPVYDFYLTDCYYGIGEYEQALHHAKKYLASGALVYGGNGNSYRMILESMRHLHLPDADMLPWAEAACREYPDLPEFYGERGMILCGLGRLSEAKALLWESLERYERGTADSRHETYFSREVAAKVSARLGEIAALEGNIGEAAVHFIRALEYCDSNAQVVNKAKKFLEEHNLL